MDSINLEVTEFPDLVNINIEENGYDVSVEVVEQAVEVSIEVVETPDLVEIVIEETSPELVEIEVNEVAGPPGPPGPAGPPGSSDVSQTGENVDSVRIEAGMAVTVGPSGFGFVRADRTDAVTKKAVGIAISSADPGFELTVQTEGPLELADWTLATGAATLPAFSRWSVGTEGLISESVTVTAGEYFQSVGNASSSSTLLIRIDEPLVRC